MKHTPNSSHLIETFEDSLTREIQRLPVVMDHAYDATLVDVDGNEYLDFLSGIGVMSLGYSNARVQRAMQEQITRLIHTSNYFYTEPLLRLSALLCEKSFARAVFFSNSGAEANEAAIKMARRAGRSRHPQKTQVISLEGSFHGRTSLALSLTDNPRVKGGFGPLPEGTLQVPLNDSVTLRAAMNPNVCALFLEPVQGEGGIHPLDQEYLRLARSLCDTYDAALIFDEVQCGMGRIGTLFAYQHFGVTPDLMTLAKALGNGMPIAATCVGPRYADTFQSGDHGTTFGGGPLATCTALAVMEELLANNLPKRAKETGAYLKSKLLELQALGADIREVRGLGLMLGAEIGCSCKPVVEKMLKRGFLINCASENVLRFLPPLIITKEEIDRMIEAFYEILQTTPGGLCAL